MGASGLGDVAVYRGRLREAVRILDTAVGADLKSGDNDPAAAKFMSIAHAEMLRSNLRGAVAAADRALSYSKAVKIRFMAARTFVEGAQREKARLLALGLASQVQEEAQAYAKIIEGEIALAAGDARLAITKLAEANQLLDTWIGHFVLGRAYLTEGTPEALARADAEFDACLKRRGEALALFIDEEPTYGHVPMVYYYQGRVREALKSAELRRVVQAVRRSSRRGRRRRAAEGHTEPSPLNRIWTSPQSPWRASRRPAAAGW